MNIASFLHSKKQYHDSTLPLPLAPVYSLPHHKWYFSSPTLVPLRKRHENSSLYKYVEELQTLGEQKQPNTEKHFNYNQTLLCLYQKNEYLISKLNHVFEVVWSQYSHDVFRKDKISCQCSTLSEDNFQSFKITTDKLHLNLQNSKKNPQQDHPQTKHEYINWLELTRTIISQHFKVPFSTQDHLHIYKLPQSTKINSNIFNLVWNNSFIVFNNGLQIKVNQRMKSKAVELAELISKQLTNCIWEHMQAKIQHVIDQIKDGQEFVSRLKEIVTPNSFKLWFYKKQKNNQIYAMIISDLTFKGVDCVLYKDIKPNQEMSVPQPAEAPTEIQLDIVDRFLVNRIKTYSLESRSSRDLRNEGSKRGKLNSIAQTNKTAQQTLQMLKRSTQSLKSKEEPTNIQCACCHHLLLSTEIINEITAKHLQKIKYLRQFKIGKNQYDPYDFIKICSNCYKVYLQHYHQNNNKYKGEKKTLSFFEYKKKKEMSKDIGKRDKTDEKKCKSKEKGNQNNQEQGKNKIKHVQHISSKKIVKNYSCKTRTKSQLNSSKEPTEFDQISRKTKEIQGQKQKLKTYCLPFKYRKNKTTHTSNTQTLDLQPSLKIPSIQQGFSLQRTITGEHQRTQQDQSLNKSKSFKLRGRISSKNHNLISKIVSQNHKTDYSDNYIEISEVQDENKSIRDQMLTNAINQYQNVFRPSFKKLVYKNHRTLLKQQIIEDPLENQESRNQMRRKSIKSYL